MTEIIQEKPANYGELEAFIFSIIDDKERIRTISSEEVHEVFDVTHELARGASARQDKLKILELARNFFTVIKEERQDLCEECDENILGIKGLSAEFFSKQKIPTE